jgi:adenosylhomocysteine nucleosidase
MPKIAIVAALEREVRPLVGSWKISEREYSGRKFRVYEDGDAVLVCGGIGPEAARRATEAILALYESAIVYSVGYAGALDPSLRVAEVVRPARVINTRDGSSVEIRGGDGVLVSHDIVAAVAQKSRLRDSYGAQVVDMEASGVARAAEGRGVPFQAVKVISDEFDFELPETGRFVSADGRFQEAAFALFVAVRPWLWPRVLQLARNSGRASRALCAELQKILSNSIPAATVR